MTEMLGVLAASSAGLHDLHCGDGQRCPLQYIVDMPAPRCFDRRRIYADARRRGGSIDVVRNKELAGVPPQVFDGVLCAAMTFVGAVTEFDQPISGVADV